jgi:F-box and WD-40 domain protein 1/11
MREATTIANRAVPWAQGRQLQHQQAANAAIPPHQTNPTNNHPVLANAANDDQDEGTSEPMASQPGNQPPPRQHPAPVAVNGLPGNALAVLQHAHALNAHVQVQAQGGAHQHPSTVPLPVVNAGSESHFRVFKLQFDARKIISASQDPRIVGWDFACGDEDIIEACQFFTGL